MVATAALARPAQEWSELASTTSAGSRNLGHLNQSEPAMADRSSHLSDDARCLPRRLVSRLGESTTVSGSSFRTRAREIAGALSSIKLPYSTRFFRLYPWDVTPRGAPVKCQDLPRTRLVTSALRCSRLDVVFDRRTVLRYPVTPGKNSRWPACRGRRPGRRAGSPRRANIDYNKCLKALNKSRATCRAAKKACCSSHYLTLIRLFLFSTQLPPQSCCR